MFTRFRWCDGALCIALGLLVPSVGCDQVPEVPPPKPPQVTVALPVQKDIREYYDFSGNTEAKKSVEIRARVQGFLESIDFSADLDPNRTDRDNPVNVHKGDRLFLIEQAPFKARVNQAEAALAAAHANLIEARANFERAVEVRDLDADAISKVQFDQLNAAHEMAKAQVAAAKAEVMTAKIDLSYTEIDAPITGRISRELVDVGNLVGAGEQTLLTTIETIDPIDVVFHISEAVLQEAQESSRKRSGSQQNVLPTVYLGLETEEGYPYKGVLTYIHNVVDPSTGTIEVRATFANPEAKMLGGNFARVRVMGQEKPDALLVDERALVTDLGGKYLLLVSDEEIEKKDGKKELVANVVTKQKVELGQLVDGMREIISGLEPTDRYIVKGIQRARPEFPVDPVMAEAPADPKADVDSTESEVDSAEETSPTETSPAAAEPTEPSPTADDGSDAEG